MPRQEGTTHVRNWTERQQTASARALRVLSQRFNFVVGYTGSRGTPGILLPSLVPVFIIHHHSFFFFFLGTSKFYFIYLFIFLFLFFNFILFLNFT